MMRRGEKTGWAVVAVSVSTEQSSTVRLRSASGWLAASLAFLGPNDQY